MSAVYDTAPAAFAQCPSHRTGGALSAGRSCDSAAPLDAGARPASVRVEVRVGRRVGVRRETDPKPDRSTALTAQVSAGLGGRDVAPTDPFGSSPHGVGAA
jgi:hypothetical protein